MKKIIVLLVIFGIAIWLTGPLNTANAQELTTIKLNAPELDKGMSVIQALKERKSVRNFTDRQLTLQELSNLLWAADGISREDGRRTAPSWGNYQEFDIYVIREDGVYVYDPKSQVLAPVAAGDYRKNAGTQDFAATAPINLIYVADMDKIKAGANENAKLMIASLDVGFIAENVALYTTSVGLASRVRASIGKEELAPILKLRPEQKIILGHTVGYPQ
jgi:SagB-type dehydrogenase family enzyme